MNITVIGHWGGYPKANEASSGYLFEEDGYRMLVDCGSGVLSKLQNHVLPEELNAVVISHYHPDHVADIGVLQHALLIGKFMDKHISTLPIYGHKADPQFDKLTYKDITKGVAYDPGDELQVGPFTIKFLRTDHPVECYAMRIESKGHSVVYTADSAYQESFIPFAADCDILLCESNFYSGMNGKSAGHMTSTEAGKLACQTNTNTLILTHLPHFGDLNRLKEEAEKEFNGTVILAKQNLEFGI
ncbi:ribonuclease BN (tRNA processing enzyme) [Bacillus ectoiniformans]|uniref:MBL fold metallo-hydrolase n=1 Tax=Bacillus ectoiniformans TaxID=1494429 RepID=UPI00195EB483|nr:MBL fold metallo-hydrolase [Bacillus ectoiniformans]MBM7647593.1 ribonuclease BN (tRNA processing enzyme) [Bacillus ectoiniformans]